jgi:lysophospholipase L1-like esterase
MTGTRPRKGLGRFWREGVLAVLALVVTLGVAELAIRLLGASMGTHYINRQTVARSSDPSLLFGLRPHAVAAAEVEYRINGHAMRDRKLPLAKPSGSLRVAVVGDSVAFGYWVAVEDAFPAQLEAMLRGARGRPGVDVLNFGVPGYNLSQELVWLETQALRFEPDLVVLAFCLNDLQSVFSYEYGLVVDREAGGGWGWARDLALRNSHLASWVDYRLTEHEVRQRFAASRSADRGLAPRPDAARRELDASFARLSAILAGAGVPGLVAVFPTLDHAFDAYPHQWLHTLVIESARSHGLAAVDLLDCLRGYAPEQVRVDPIHPNPLGHRVAAHAARDAVVAGGLLAHVSTEEDSGDCQSYRSSDFPAVRGY